MRDSKSACKSFLSLFNRHLILIYRSGLPCSPHYLLSTGLFRYLRPHPPTYACAYLVICISCQPPTNEATPFGSAHCVSHRMIIRSRLQSRRSRRVLWTEAGLRAIPASFPIDRITGKSRMTLYKLVFNASLY